MHGPEPAASQRADNPSVKPTRSASSRPATTPPSVTTPVPSAMTDHPLRPRNKLHLRSALEIRRIEVRSFLTYKALPLFCSPCQPISPERSGLSKHLLVFFMIFHLIVPAVLMPADFP
jgi:hypothetical protein